MHIPFAPSRPEDEVTMRQLYVPPKIVDKGQKPNEKSDKQVNTFNDFFKKEGSLCKQIFLLGEPGTGKSTFFQNLALEWSLLHKHDETSRRDENEENNTSRDDSTIEDNSTSDDDAFQDKTTLEIIDVLFYVSLRDANKYCNYFDIINDQLLQKIYGEDEIPDAKSLVKKLLAMSSSFVLSDGLDEWDHPSNGDCSCPKRDKGRTPLINRLNSATIVTSSRPWRFAQIPTRSSKVEKFLEIQGTSNPDKLGQKMVAVLNKQETEKCIRFEDVKSYALNKGVDILMTVPILLLQIVCLCFDGTEVSNSQCKIYASIFDMMIGRHRQTLTEQSSACDTRMSLFTDKVYIRQFWTQFIALAKLAFEQLFQQQGHSSVVFNNKTCNLENSVRRFACVCGLLTEKKSRSYSSPDSHLSFTHKTFQEFLAAVYMSINEKLFETVIKPRHAVADQGSLERCLDDLAQVFLFTCGLNIEMAKKIATLFNNHYRSDMTINSSIEYVFPWSRLSYMYCEKIRVGIAEADENGFKHFTFPLQCIDVAITDEKDTTVCRRLLDMNIERLFSVFIYTDHYKSDLDYLVKVTGGISLQNCARLQSLQLRGLDLGDQQLHLPDTLTNIVIKYVKVKGCISLQNCTRLQAIRLNLIDIPDSPTHMHTVDRNLPRVIHLQKCTLLQTLKLKGVRFGENEFLSAQNFENLQELKLVDINLDDQELMLPNSLTSLCLERVTTVSGRNGGRNTSAQKQYNQHSASISFMDTTCLGTLRLLNCTQLKTIVLRTINMSDHELLLPESITSITLDRVNTSKDVKLPLQHCTSLQELQLADVKLGDKLVLPDSITGLDLTMVTECLSSFTSLQNLSRLQTISLASIDLGNLELMFPVSVKKVHLSSLKMSRGLPLLACSQLIAFTIYSMNLANTELKLPNSITNIEMRQVTMSALSVQELCEHFQRLSHAVTFKVILCTIEPINDYKQFIERLIQDVDIEIISRFGDKVIEIRFNCNSSAASSEL